MLIWGWASAVHRRAAIHPETSKWYSLSAGADSIVLVENLVSASRHTQGSPSNTAAIWGSIAKRFTVSEGAFDCRLGKSGVHMMASNGQCYPWLAVRVFTSYWQGHGGQIMSRLLFRRSLSYLPKKRLDNSAAHFQSASSTKCYSLGNA
jgi:hypothetical protein